MVSFQDKLKQAHLSLSRKPLKVLQVNLGKRCHLTCQHCHVGAGPKRIENMTRQTAEAVLSFLDQSSVKIIDLTGGAPELNPNFKFLVQEARKRSLHVIDRSNLAVFFEKGFEELPRFLADHQVEIMASLSCYTKENVDRQRGQGVFEKSIFALQRLNQFGYGKKPELILNLIYNPGGAFLPGPQEALEADYKKHLHEDYNVQFNCLFTLTNMPINRFKTYLRKQKKYEEYLSLLEKSFNADTVPNLMCREMLSVSWDGKVYDCDFNQMLDMAIPSLSIENLTETIAYPIATGQHCYGCTAGAGSSCSGALKK